MVEYEKGAIWPLFCVRRGYYLASWAGRYDLCTDIELSDISGE